MSDAGYDLFRIPDNLDEMTEEEQKAWVAGILRGMVDDGTEEDEVNP